MGYITISRVSGLHSYKWSQSMIHVFIRSQKPRYTSTSPFIVSVSPNQLPSLIKQNFNFRFISNVYSTKHKQQFSGSPHWMKPKLVMISIFSKCICNYDFGRNCNTHTHIDHEISCYIAIATALSKSITWSSQRRWQNMQIFMSCGLWWCKAITKNVIPSEESTDILMPYHLLKTARVKAITVMNDCSDLKDYWRVECYDKDCQE